MRLALILCLLLPALATGQTAPVDMAVGPAGASTQTANSAAGNIPTAATDGVALKNQCRALVTVSAASGQTLSGGGTLVFWYYDANLARWAVNIEGTNPPMTAASGVRDITIAVRRTFPSSVARMYVEADTVTSSSGALTVRIRTMACETVR